TLALGSSNGSTQTWNTFGTISVANGTLMLGGSTSSVGAITLTGSKLQIVGSYTTTQIQPLLGQGNSVSITQNGALNNTGSTLAPDAPPGPLPLSGGALKGGTPQGTAGANVIVLGSGNTLDGVTLDADLDLATSSASVTVQHGLTLNGTATIGDGTSTSSSL